MHSPTLAKKQRPSTTRSAISFQKSRIPPFPIFLSRLDSSYNHWRSRQDGWIIPLKRTLSLPDFRVAFLVEHFLQGWLGSTLSLSQVIAFSSSRASFHLWRYNQSVSQSIELVLYSPLAFSSFFLRLLLLPLLREIDASCQDWYQSLINPNAVTEAAR